MKSTHAPNYSGTASDWSRNVLKEKKFKIKKRKTVDEYGNSVVKQLIVRK